MSSDSDMSGHLDPILDERLWLARHGGWTVAWPSPCGSVFCCSARHRNGLVVEHQADTKNQAAEMVADEIDRWHEGGPGKYRVNVADRATRDPLWVEGVERFDWANVWEFSNDLRKQHEAAVIVSAARLDDAGNVVELREWEIG